MKGKENCAMFQFKEGVGCYHGKSKSDCQKWKSATRASSRGWFGGEVNNINMENQLRHTRNSRFEEMLKSVDSIRAVMPQGKSTYQHTAAMSHPGELNKEEQHQDEKQQQANSCIFFIFHPIISSRKGCS